ncbi:hypothetical protein P3T27_006639 [Kitasatospora sp. MAA19]|uniref:hypothetical protein n=1 Tax=Kitasatospora sp. MAA19 TaxID=3035090 RepID=UPI002474DFFA|nr:hypothetical protein [Kitasatospora sp. MAA19]MDH6709890.1 hypothetical protein [Kitasatospora sp. MAA19]
MRRVIAPSPDSPSSQAVGVDFDETLMLVDRGWMDGQVYGEPIPGAIEALRLLAQHRAVFVYTYAVSDMSALRSSGAIQIKRSGRAGLAGVLHPA